MIPVVQADVEKRLKRELTDDESAELPGCAEEASVLVEGYLAYQYATSESIPFAVTVVTSRVASRMLVDNGLPAQADSLTRGMGPFSATTHLVSDSTSGGPWLSKGDKIALEPYRIGGMVTIPLVREGS